MNNKLLEPQLGVPFFDSLQAIAKLRVQTLSDSQAAGYISTVLDGLAERHPWLDDDDFMFDFAKAACGDRLDSIASCANDEVNNQVFRLAMDDLLTALGRNERLYQQPSGDLVFSRDDMLALDEVWRMAKFNCGEMVERMHRFEKQ